MTAYRYLVLALAAVVLFACAHLTSQDRSDLGEYSAQQSACIVAHPGNKVLIDKCRDDVKRDWANKWDQRFDGGFGDGSKGDSQ